MSRILNFLLFFVVNCSVFAQSPCLIAEYKFTGNTRDSVGGYHGTNYGATLTADRFGKSNSAYYFNKSDQDHITIPYTPFLLSNYSYSVWVKPNTNPSNGSAYIFLSVGGTGGDQNMQIENNQDNALLGYLTGFTITAYNINGNLRAGVATGSLPTVGNWYHVVCTRDSNFFKIYLNGCLVSTSPSTNGSLPYYGDPSTRNAEIGMRNNDSRWFDGALDDVGIYNCALDAKEVAKLYNDYKPFKASNDTSICLAAFKPFKLKASRNYCAYKWIDVSNRKNILGTDSNLLININKTTVFRVFNHIGDSATVKVTISDNEIVLPRDTIYCDSFTRTITLAGGHKYLWSNNDSGNSITIKSPGTYWVKKVGSNLCNATDTIVIGVAKPKKINLGRDTTLCPNFSLVLNSDLIQKRYSWNTGDTMRSKKIVNPGTYVLNGTDANNCQTSDTIVIKVFILPQFSLGRDTSFCGNFQMTLKAHDSSILNAWSNGSNQKQLNISSQGLYWVNSTFPNGCKIIDTINVQSNPKPTVKLIDTFKICSGESVILRVNKYKKVVWNGAISDTFLSINSSGRYIVEVENEFGCTAKDTSWVIVYPKAKAKFTTNYTELPLLKANFKFTNLASGYTSLKYDFGDGNYSDSTDPYHFYKSLGYFKVHQFALDSNGCHDTATLQLFVFDDFKIFFPNSFSPNNDGFNDVFYPGFTGVDGEDYELMVFNRWGELLFISNDTKIGWDGKYKGEIVEQGVYLYILKLRTSRKTKMSYSGTFTLLR